MEHKHKAAETNNDCPFYKVRLRAEKRPVTVTLDGEALAEDHVGISLCQFGEVPAPQKSYKLVKNQAAISVIDDSGSTDSTTEADDVIFKFDSDLFIPENLHVRFNLTLQVDEHNAVNVQIRIDQNQKVEWRWLAYIGATSEWVTGNSYSTWQDDGNQYLIYMVHESGSKDFWVYLGQTSMVSQDLPAFFPAGAPIPKPLRFNYDEEMKKRYDETLSSRREVSDN